MPRQNAFIPVSKGIDQRLDERLRSPDSLTSLINGEYHRNDAVRKRHGFTALTKSVQGGGGASNLLTFGAPKALLSTGDELLVRGRRQLYAYQEGNATVSPSWWYRGELSPFTGRQRTLFADQRNVGSCDTTQTSDSMAIHAVTSLEPKESLDFSVELPDKTIVVNKVSIVSTQPSFMSSVTDPDITGCRVVASTNGVNSDSAFVGVQRNKTYTFVTYGTGYGSLQFYRWSSAAPTTLPVIAIFHEDLYYPSGAVTPFYNYRRYDTCQTDDGWSYAYLRDTTPPIGGTTNVIALYRKNDAATAATVTIAPPAPYDYWVNVALHSSSTTGNTYVIATAVNAATNNVAIYAYARNATTLAAVWGPVLLASYPGSGIYPLPISVGVTQGLDSNAFATQRVVFVWSIVSSNSLSDFRSTHIASLLTNGTGQQNHNAMLNAYPVSKPWFESGRCYMAVRPAYRQEPGGVDWVDGYAGETVVDCGIGDVEDPSKNIYRRCQMVGRYNFGAAAGHQYWQRIAGSLQTVTPNAVQQIYRYASQRIANIGGGVNNLLCACDEVELDFDGISTNDKTTRGAAALGGGSVGYYASCVAEELGWCSAPFIAALESVAAGSLPHGTYQYCCTLESYDEQGNLTRSAPGPVWTHVLAGMFNSVRIYPATIGPTLRYGKRRFGVGIYRAGADGLFRRCIEPSESSLDNETDWAFAPLRVDDGGNSFDVLYTQGGAEVEAAGPDGAAFVTTTSKRVWLAGFFRRDRVQYSKPYDPSTASEYALAPEFNDAFAFLLPGGEACTGLIEMDDKVIVFTASSIFAIAGNGPDDGGRNNDFSGLQLVSSDAGCVDPRSLVSTPMGVFFQAPSGMFLLGRDLQVNFIGARVRDLTDVYSEVTSAVIVPAANHVRFTCRSVGESIILCYDFDQNVWLRWDPRRLSGPTPIAMSLVGACLHDGKYHVLEANGTVYYEDPTTFYDDASIYIPLSVETSWLQAAEQSGWQRIRTVAAMCERLDNHDLTMTLTQDFGGSTQTYTWSSATIADQKLKELVEMRTQVQKCTAFKIAISDAAPAGLPAAVTGQGVKVLGFQVELSGKRGMYKPGTQQRN